MPRHREFDRYEALQAAMELFWQKGYGDTSMEDIVERTGVSRYGIYSEFGSKHGLFIEALDRYYEVVAGWRVGPLEQADAGLKELRAFWEFFIELADAPEAAMGCLMCNTATELGPFDAEAEQRVAKYFARMCAGFRNAIDNAIRNGELDRTPQEAEQLASHLGMTLLGISAAGRFAAGRAAVVTAVRQVLELLQS